MLVLHSIRLKLKVQLKLSLDPKLIFIQEACLKTVHSKVLVQTSSRKLLLLNEEVISNSKLQSLA